MAIYGEYLFLENFATGLMILFFTGKILGRKPGTMSMLLCGCCCGAYAFVLFLPLAGLFSWLCKAAFSVFIVRAAFGIRERKKLLQGTVVFLGVTIFYGGIAIAFLTSLSRTGVTAAAGVYLPPLTYTAVTAAATGAALFLWLVLNILKTRRMEVRRTMEAELILGAASWKLQGFIDSGNDLTDPLTGKPVCMIDRQQGKKLLEEAGGIAMAETRFRAIPYRAVGTNHGMLEGYRMDVLRLSDGLVLKNPVIAFCEEDHFGVKDGEPQILLPASLLERGVYGDI